MTEDDGKRWHYGSVGSNGEQVNFRILQEMTNEEREGLKAAGRLLSAVGPTSSYAALHDQFRLFEQIVEDTEHDLAAKLQEPGLVTRFGSAVDNVLFAFRAFLDRTAHQLSAQYGKDSAELAAFSAAQREEFDRFIEYRLCSKLRNMSQHVGHVISRVHSRGERNERGEMEVVAFEVVIEPKRLLEQFDKWGEIVKADLEEMDDDIHVKDLIAGLEASCHVLMANVLIAQEAAIVDGIERVRSAAAACDLGEDDAPMAVWCRPDEMQTPGRFRPTFEPIPVEFADLAERNLFEARRALSELV